MSRITDFQPHYLNATGPARMTKLSYFLAIGPLPVLTDTNGLWLPKPQEVTDGR